MKPSFHGDFHFKLHKLQVNMNMLKGAALKGLPRGTLKTVEGVSVQYQKIAMKYCC